MKAIFSMTIVALFSTILAGCWFYTRPDETTAGCQKTTYGLAIATTSTENCAPAADAGAPPPNVPPGPPPIPPAATP
ncbi:hypothetical protein [Candidatus Binatus sp.]|uniref:hypothetical protein n=1 Tax=Candidatus Binatus sp. TaxID=2811406 RepID=UPI003CB90EA2